MRSSGHYKSLVGILMICMPLGLFAQNTIPNASFETWNASGPDGWTTNNTGSYVAVTRIMDAKDGNYAVRGTVIQGLNSITQPPVLQSISGNYGFPVDDAFTTVTFWFKTFLYGGDRFNINAYIYNNTLTMVGGGSLSIASSESNYTSATVPITLFTTGAAYAMLSFTLADGSGMTNGHLQSWFQLDALSGPTLWTQPIVLPSYNCNSLAVTGRGIEFTPCLNGRFLIKAWNAIGQVVLDEEAYLSQAEQHVFTLTTKPPQGSIIIVQMIHEGVLVENRKLVVLR
jgi:hypothetical protein